MSLRRCELKTRFIRHLPFDKINIQLLIILLFRCSSRPGDISIRRRRRRRRVLGRDAVVVRVHSEHAFDCMQGHHHCVTAFPLAYKTTPAAVQSAVPLPRTASQFGRHCRLRGGKIPDAAHEVVYKHPSVFVTFPEAGPCVVASHEDQRGMLTRCAPADELQERIVRIEWPVSRPRQKLLLVQLEAATACKSKRRVLLEVVTEALHACVGGGVGERLLEAGKDVTSISLLYGLELLNDSLLEGLGNISDWPALSFFTPKASSALPFLFPFGSELAVMT